MYVQNKIDDKNIHGSKDPGWLELSWVAISHFSFDQSDVVEGCNFLQLLLIVTIFTQIIWTHWFWSNSTLFAKAYLFNILYIYIKKKKKKSRRD